MSSKSNSILTNNLRKFGAGIFVLLSVVSTGFSSQMVSNQHRSIQAVNFMPSPQTYSQNPDSECSAVSDQTVVEWISMYWFPCRLSWKGICTWPPFRRRHVTYKVTVNGGAPVRNAKNRPTAIAKGKPRDWLVYDSATWNNLPDYPREFARYPDYEQIALDEYVVLVETRYRWFNDVESTLRICVE